jgi:JmjC domain, hydroxylase
VSPSLLASHGIKVNKLIHHQGEFVITFPFGYHSGYNLGYNCAESVNFATEAWLEYGRNAKKCECVKDSVWVDVEEIERKLRGESTEDEYEEFEYYDDDDEDEMEATDLPTPPESVEGKPAKLKSRPRKRKADEGGGLRIKVKRLKLKFSREPAPEPVGIRRCIHFDVVIWR